MNSSARRMLFSGLIFWAVVAGLCIYSVLPLDKKLKRGIDLVGGSYLTLEVQTEKAVESELMGIAQRISERLKKADKPLPKTKEFKNEEAVLSFHDINEAQAALPLIKNERDVKISVDDKKVILRFTEKKAKKIKSDSISTNIEVFRTRLATEMSAAEITIAPEGERNIIIELPGVTDRMKARTMIGKPAVLEFKLVERSASSEDEILYEYDGEIPDDMEVLPEYKKDKPTKYHLVPKYTDLTGKLLRDARSSVGGSLGMSHVVNFRFSSEGGDKFYELTSRNFKRSVAIVLDNVVLTAPQINSAIRSEGYIEGGDLDSDSAKELAMLLRSGALVAPVTIEGEQQIGPTLGSEYIRQGLISCLVGLGLLLIFSIFYYSLSGLFAFIALMFNLCLVLFGLHATGSVLTLPGIAGMVLTVGMAIDASILIYERIKDGLREGLSIKNAVNTGFSNAMVVILDANITTFIVGVVLYKFGTGPLQGFAVTMMLGIISTLITGLLFLRSIFNFVLDNFRVQKLRI